MGREQALTDERIKRIHDTAMEVVHRYYEEHRDGPLVDLIGDLDIAVTTQRVIMEEPPHAPE